VKLNWGGGEKNIQSVVLERKKWVSMVWDRFLEVEMDEKWIRESKIFPV
jgi:hypothetical protein